jgi:hypothetical protein
MVNKSLGSAKMKLSLVYIFDTLRRWIRVGLLLHRFFAIYWQISGDVGVPVSNGGRRGRACL